MNKLNYLIPRKATLPKPFEVIELATINRDEYIEKYKNKIKEFQNYLDKTNFYKSWNKFVNRHIEEFEEDIKDLKNSIMKYKNFMWLDRTLEDLISVYVKNDTWLKAYRDKEWIEQEESCQLLFNGINVFNLNGIDVFNNKVLTFKNGTFSYLNIDKINRYSKKYTAEKLAITKSEYDNRAYAFINSEIKNFRTKEKYLIETLFIQLKDNFNYWEYLKTAYDEDVLLRHDVIEIRFVIYIKANRRYITFKGQSLTKENLISKIVYNEGTEGLDIREYLEKIFDVKY